ncbi:MAG: hypothetical protein AB1589_37470, partial [Cyanobacteriota bacterium]
AVDLTGVEQAIADIQGQLEALNQQFTERPELQTLEQSQGAIALLAEQLDAVTQRLEQAATPQSVDLTGVEQAIAELRDQLNSNIEQSQGAIALLAEQLDVVTQRLEHEPTPQAVDLTGVEQAIAELRDQLNSNIEQSQGVITLLAEQLDVVTQRLEHEPTPQAANLTGVEQAIAELRGQLDSNIEQSQGVITLLAEQLDVVTQRLEQAPMSPAIDLSGIEQAIVEISTQLETLRLRVDNLPTLSEVKPSDHEAATGDIQGQQDIMASLVDHLPLPTQEDVKLSDKEAVPTGIESPLDELNQQFQARPETQAIKQIDEALTQLIDRLGLMALRLGRFKASAEVDLNGAKQAIADSLGQLDTLSQLFYARPETQSIEQIKEAIAQFAEVDCGDDEKALADFKFQLDAMALCLESLPPPLEFDLTWVEQALTEVDSHLDLLQGSAKTVSASPSVDPWQDETSQNKDKLDTANQAANSQQSTEAAIGLESAIEQLQEQLKLAISYLENLPDPQDAVWGSEDDIASLQW